MLNYLPEHPTNRYEPPDPGGILLNYGLAAEAMPFVLRSLEANPTNPRAIANYAVALSMIGEYEECLGYFEQAIKGAPLEASIMFNRGLALEELGKYKEAQKDFENAFRLNPELSVAELALAFSYLREGRFDEGWPHWVATQTRQKFRDVPWWTGQDLSGKHVLVIREGGYGDTFLFWRYLTVLKELGAEITYYGWSNMKSLLEFHPYIDHWKSAPDPINAEDYDYQTGIMSINLRPIVPEMPMINVTADSEMHGKLRVGLTWDSGEMLAQGRKNRALPLEALEPFKDLNASFVAIQPGVTPANWMQDTRETLVDWKATAELLANLDLVISVDTAVAHLAGNMGVPTWVLLPPRSDWRWFQERTDSPFYPTVKLYRNSEPRSWKKTIEQVASDLNAIA